MILLNHDHLHYFWMAAREGGIAKACAQLHLAQPTVSAQIIAFEKALGAKLFERDKRRLKLTDTGRLVFDYATQIFGYTTELLDALKDRPSGRALQIQIDVVDQVSRQASHRLVQSLMKFAEPVQPTILEGTLPHLLHEMRTHRLDVILSNHELPVEEAGEYVRRLVGSLPIHFVAAPALARRVRRFPQDLSGIPMILPTRASPIWGSVEHFLNKEGIVPQIRAEVQDPELLRLMALDGMGVAPLNAVAIEEDLKKKRLVRVNRRPTDITKTLWLIARKRHRMNPAADYLLREFQFKA